MQWLYDFVINITAWMYLKTNSIFLDISLQVCIKTSVSTTHAISRNLYAKDPLRNGITSWVLPVPWPNYQPLTWSCLFQWEVFVLSQNANKKMFTSRWQNELTWAKLASIESIPQWTSTTNCSSIKWKWINQNMKIRANAFVTQLELWLGDN